MTTNKKTKIFVTTGSVLEFDDLVKVIDNINKNKKYNIVIQIGKGRYLPKNCKYFKFTDDINKHYSWADVVVTHTGVGTINELFLKNKKIVTIDNPKGYNEIAEIAKKYHKDGYLIYLPFKKLYEDNNILDDKIKEVIKKKFKKYKKEKNNIGKEILNFLRK